MDSDWLVSRPADETTVYNGDHQKAVMLNLINQSAKDAQALSSAIGNFYAVGIEKQLAFVWNQRVICGRFSSTIDDFDVLEDGFLVVAERDGLVSLGTVDTEEGLVKLANNTKLCQASPEGRTFCRVLFQAEAADTEGAQRARVIAVTANSELIMCNNICLSAGAIDLSEIEIQRVSIPPGVVSDMAVSGDRIIAVGPDTMWVMCFIEGEILLEASLNEVMVEAAELTGENAGSVDMTKIGTVPDAPFFITMDAAGQFYVWDCLTLTVVHTWQISGALDFRLVIDQGVLPSLPKLQMLVLRESEVLFVSLPSLKPKAVYQLTGSHASLTRCPITQDDVLVVEKQIIDDEIEEETHVSLRLYAEANPQKRLTRLLSRRRFQEAEALAKLYGLKYELDPGILESMMREGKETYEETVQHLDSCRQKLLKNTSDPTSAKIVLSELDNLQNRLQAYDKVFGRENFRQVQIVGFLKQVP
ncbi:kinetochore-associated protein 1-like [Elysia marginata]|uniref:Kinetochore-associated protein 1-like n=1 Tax=Elysia marginata TaxID=1093978 RepID=A0AAV4J1G4_9GAST|nr:kinetochore-associated protein 1-like [Elysia marginata]